MTHLPGQAFRMVHLVRIADMLADALGFAVVAQASQMRFGEVLEELPEGALCDSTMRRRA